MREKVFYIGDFVMYTGNFNIQQGPLRQEGIGRIDQFEIFHGIERIYLYLSDRNQHIWCDYERLRSIETEERHLLATGFELEMIDEKKRYRRGEVVISGGLIIIPVLNLTVLTGYCIADFTGGLVNIQKYLEEDRFNLALFYQDFPSVNNINELIDLMNERHVHMDWQEILNG